MNVGGVGSLNSMGGVRDVRNACGMCGVCSLCGVCGMDGMNGGVSVGVGVERVMVRKVCCESLLVSDVCEKWRDW